MDDSAQGLLETLGSRNGMTRKRAREALTLAGDSAVSQLQALLASSDKRVRWEAVKALSVMIDPGSLETFVALLDERDSDLRWLAATGLIGLGPRSVRPVVRSLTDPAAPRGHLEMSGRVLGELAKDNALLAQIVAPLIEVLDRGDPGVITQRAARALSDLDDETRRLPETGKASATPD
jgi:HEAT repeat protein